nr:MAG TPA: hypothetical protein [Caudoviricetes sp.]
MDRQGRLEVQRYGWEVRVGGGTAELVHCGDGLQAVLERTGPVQGEGRQARMQMNTGS